MSNVIIDCELHAAAPAMSNLLPYMEQVWAERVARTRFHLPDAGSHPGGGKLSGAKSAPGPQEVAAGLSASVKAALLVPHQIMPAVGWCDTRLCSVFASALNRYLLEHWIPKDPRFRLALALSPLEPELAAKEIRTLGKHERVVAVSFSPVSVNLGQSHYQPILEAAAECDLPVIIHPSGSEGLVLGAPLLGGSGPRRNDEIWTLLTQVAAVNIASLIYDGVFVQFPKLKVVFAGYGFEWAVPMMWRADTEWRNLRIDIPWVKDPPSRFMERNIRFIVDDLGAAPLDMIRHIADTLPETMLIYGSNSPFATGDEQSVLRGMPDALRERVAHINAEETFRLAA